MFHLGDVLTITTGILVAPSGINAVYSILNFMTGDNLFTHQLPRAADECRPHLLRQHPQLRSSELLTAADELVQQLKAVHGKAAKTELVNEWLSQQSTIYGQEFQITRIPKDDHTVKNPIEELIDMVGPEKVIVVEVPSKK